MNKNKFDLKNKMRENFSNVEKFTHKYMVETMTIAAIVIAAVSASMDFFVGTLGWSVLLLVIGAVLGIFMPRQMDWAMKKVYSYSKGSRMSAIIAESVKIAVALLLPFLYFGFLGIMTGTAYQYYIHTFHSGHKGNKAA